MRLKDIFSKTKIFIAACFWYAIGMRVRAKNRFRLLFGHTSPLLYQNQQRGRAICIAQNEVSDAERLRLEEIISRWIDPPLISIVMPVYNTKPEHLREAIHSVQAQVYANWELCIADDASTDNHIHQILFSVAKEDPRIKLEFRSTNGHISAATNSALQLVEGEFVALMDHDDVLPAHALFHIASEILDNPEVDFIYSDEDKILADGKLDGPHFKPDWNEELLISQNYINHFSVYRTSLIKNASGLRESFEGSQDHDLVLRCALKTSSERIRHIPKILYHWRAYHGSGSFSDNSLRQAIISRQRAARDYLKVKYPDRQYSVVHGPFGCNRVFLELPSPAPKVSIIIPTRDQLHYLEKCVFSIFDKTAYPDFEVIVVDNNSKEASTHEYFQRIQQLHDVRVIEYGGPFNYSAINNFAASEATGTVLALLNNDTEVISENWLRELVSYAIREEIGCVGARLLYQNGTVQHAGVILGVGGIANHAFHGYDRMDTGYNARLQLPQYVSAVTGACLVVEKGKYFAVNGMNEDLFKVAFNDVDLCLMMSKQGLKNVYTPYAELYHYESVSRGRDLTPEKMRRLQNESQNMIDKWGHEIEVDIYYNENFSNNDGCFQFRDLSLN